MNLVLTSRESGKKFIVNWDNVIYAFEFMNGSRLTVKHSSENNASFVDCKESLDDIISILDDADDVYLRYYLI